MLVDISHSILVQLPSFFMEREDMRNINYYLDFIKDYQKSLNAATGSVYDANANVSSKNIATLAAEIHKKQNIAINRQLMVEKLKELYDERVAEKYIRQLTNHQIYKHDETSSAGFPYCVSLNLYPFLLKGLTEIGGETTAPTNLQSFNGSLINLVFLVASQFAGAVATPEYLLYTDYFVRKEFGENWYQRLDEVVYVGHKTYTIQSIIEDGFQQVVYSLNQPASARGYQSVFWNIAYFDKYYFESLFELFYFPDQSRPIWESLSALQKLFMTWFNQERSKQILTFPVETLSLLYDEKGIVDKNWHDYAATMYAQGHSFFVYLSDSIDSLASCCRLRNAFTENTFSYSLGAGGIATGSKSVITINLNRLVQDVYKKDKDNFETKLDHALRSLVHDIYCYHHGFNEILKDFQKAKMLPIYDAGFITLEKQYLTIGLNGIVEAAEFLNIPISDNRLYQKFINTILTPIYQENKKAKTKELMFNTEFVPAENLGVKHATWDKEAGYQVNRDVYNSYFYRVEEDLDILEKFRLHGRKNTEFLDGGVAYHCNLDEHLSKNQYLKLLDYAALVGCSYFTFNVPNTICNECGYITKHNLVDCPKCQSSNVDKITRVIGYLKRVSNFSEPRQIEAGTRYYAKGN